MIKILTTVVFFRYTSFVGDFHHFELLTFPKSLCACMLSSPKEFHPWNFACIWCLTERPWNCPPFYIQRVARVRSINHRLFNLRLISDSLWCFCSWFSHELYGTGQCWIYQTDSMDWAHRWLPVVTNSLSRTVYIGWFSYIFGYLAIWCGWINLFPLNYSTLKNNLVQCVNLEFRMGFIVSLSIESVN